jgi:uncharacterized membrane protein YvbJ
MYCSNCGKEIAENMKFCPYCGTPLNSGVTNNQDKASLACIIHENSYRRSRALMLLMFLTFSHSPKK